LRTCYTLKLYTKNKNVIMQLTKRAQFQLQNAPKIVLRLGSAQTSWESLQRSPAPKTGFIGSGKKGRRKERGRKGREGKYKGKRKEREKRGGRGREGEKRRERRPHSDSKSRRLWWELSSISGDDGG